MFQDYIIHFIQSVHKVNSHLTDTFYDVVSTSRHKNAQPVKDRKCIAIVFN